MLIDNILFSNSNKKLKNVTINITEPDNNVVQINLTHIGGTEFYNTVKEINILGKIYKLAEDKFFDIYDQGQRLTFLITNVLRNLHNGVLPTYLVWCLLGMIVMFFVLR